MSNSWFNIGLTADVFVRIKYDEGHVTLSVVLQNG